MHIRSYEIILFFEVVKTHGPCALFIKKDADYRMIINPRKKTTEIQSFTISYIKLKGTQVHMTV